MNFQLFQGEARGSRTFQHWFLSICNETCTALWAPAASSSDLAALLKSLYARRLCVPAPPLRTFFRGRRNYCGRGAKKNNQRFQVLHGLVTCKWALGLRLVDAFVNTGQIVPRVAFPKPRDLCNIRAMHLSIYLKATALVRFPWKIRHNGDCVFLLSTVPVLE
jgi:hypothetical protein